MTTTVDAGLDIRCVHPHVRAAVAVALVHAARTHGHDLLAIAGHFANPATGFIPADDLDWLTDRQVRHLGAVFAGATSTITALTMYADLNGLMRATGRPYVFEHGLPT